MKRSMLRNQSNLKWKFKKANQHHNQQSYDQIHRLLFRNRYRKPIRNHSIRIFKLNSSSLKTPNLMCHPMRVIRCFKISWLRIMCNNNSRRFSLSMTLYQLQKEIISTRISMINNNKTIFDEHPWRGRIGFYIK